MPNGRLIINRSNKRQTDNAIKTTDYLLHADPGPIKIARLMYTNDTGMINNDDNSFSHDFGTTMQLGHSVITKQIYRLPIGVGGYSSDDNIEIASPSIASNL